MEITFPDFLGGLNIPNVGRRIGKTLQESGFDDWGKLTGTGIVSEISEIHGLGWETAGAIVNGINKKVSVIKALFDVGIKIKEKVDMGSSDNPLAGKSVVFTGALSLKRKEAQQMVIEKGGMCPSSISKNVDILVIADPTSTSSKAQKARSLGITMIDEATFLEMVG